MRLLLWFASRDAWFLGAGVHLCNLTTFTFNGASWSRWGISLALFCFNLAMGLRAKR